MSAVLTCGKSGPRALVLSLLVRAIDSTREMLESREVSHLVLDHPVELSADEVSTLQAVLGKLEETKATFESSPNARDVLIEDIFTSEDTIRVLRQWKVHTLMDLWQFDSKALLGVYEYCRLLGDRKQLQMYFFVNSHD